MIYGTPVPLLQKIIDSRHFSELIAAEKLGLLAGHMQEAVVRAFGGESKAKNSGRMSGEDVEAALRQRYG